MNLAAAEEMARMGRLYPAVILHGGGAEERQAAAVELARTLLCEADRNPPCGRCRHCRRIGWPGEDGAGFHPDFLVLERDLKTATSVDATRAWLQSAQVTPFEARGQVFVVASAESLSGEAANTLLKTLEEPHLTSPRHFLLLAPSQFDLLPTLRSRSLAVYLGAGRAFDAERLEELASAFGAAVAALGESGDAVQLFAAAAALEEGGDWSDPRAPRSWELAAAAVTRASSAPGVAPPLRRRLLALAEELLGGPAMRVRGIPARRILEGLVHRHLSGGVR